MIVGEGVMILFVLASFVSGALTAYVWMGHRAKRRYPIT